MEKKGGITGKKENIRGGGTSRKRLSREKEANMGYWKVISRCKFKRVPFWTCLGEGCCESEFAGEGSRGKGNERQTWIAVRRKNHGGVEQRGSKRRSLEREREKDLPVGGEKSDGPKIDSKRRKGKRETLEKKTCDTTVERISRANGESVRVRQKAARGKKGENVVLNWYIRRRGGKAQST